MQVEKLAAENLTEQAHRSIRQYILRGNLTHGHRMTEDFFAQELGISKAPVREAMNALQAEGLLRIKPRQGAYLRYFSAKEVADLYDLREAIEVFASATMLITPELIERLAENVSRTARLLEQQQKAEYIDADVDFHQLIIEATENVELLRVYANIQSKLWLCRCQTYQLTSPDTPDAHREIYEAIARSNREEAADAMRRHIRFVKRVLLGTMREVAAGEGALGV